MLDESSVAVTGECEDAENEYDGDDSGHVIFCGHLCGGTKSCQTLRHKRISRVLLGQDLAGGCWLTDDHAG